VGANRLHASQIGVPDLVGAALLHHPFGTREATRLRRGGVHELLHVGVAADDAIERHDVRCGDLGREITVPAAEPAYARPSPDIPSMNSLSGATAKPKPKVYSGKRRLLGVATMHKSNMVPVFADKPEEAAEIAKMRR